MSLQEDFISVYENAYSQEFCNAAIKYYEDMDAAGFGTNRLDGEGKRPLSKNDTTTFTNEESVISLDTTKDLLSHFNERFWGEHYKDYVQKFDVISGLSSHNSFSARIQKTKIGGGYHTWHCETDSRFTSNRILGWMLYLNDVEEGGETEFLYQHKRIKPKTGSLVIWPAAFTHTHRGNPPLTNTKYIITGWVEF